MAPQRRSAQQLARDFVASYPESLPSRLAWLEEHLRIDRVRFLRLLGLSPEEIEDNLHASWETITERWEYWARWIEELLRQLVALFGYDWRALADLIRPPAEIGVRPTRREEILLARIAEGGPGVRRALIEYLMQTATNGALPQSP